MEFWNNYFLAVKNKSTVISDLRQIAAYGVVRVGGEFAPPALTEELNPWGLLKRARTGAARSGQSHRLNEILETLRQ